jgi:hypothetical protein
MILHAFAHRTYTEFGKSQGACSPRKNDAIRFEKHNNIFSKPKRTLCHHQSSPASLSVLPSLLLIHPIFTIIYLRRSASCLLMLRHSSSLCRSAARCCFSNSSATCDGRFWNRTARSSLRLADSDHSPSTLQIKRLLKLFTVRRR